MPRPICVPCSKEMSCIKNGVLVRLCPGAYQYGDAYGCSQCGAQIVTGFAHKPVQSAGGQDVVADLSGSVVR